MRALAAILALLAGFSGIEEILVERAKAGRPGA